MAGSGRGADHRRRAGGALNAVRDMRIAFSVMNRRIGAEVGLRDIDFDCFEVIRRDGPIGPSELARRVGVHLATMTGVLNRLEAGGWIVRTRTDADRRAVVIEVNPDGIAGLDAIYRPMDARFAEICAGFSADELATVTEFVTRITEIGATKARELAAGAGGSD